MKEPTRPTLSRRPSATVVIPDAQTEGPFVSTEPIKVQKEDMGVGIDFMICNKKEAPEASTQGEGNPATSISATTSTSEVVGISSRPTYQSSLATASGIVLVSNKVLHSLVDTLSSTTRLLENIEIYMATLYEQILLWVQK